jgi:bacteriorhodopsin
VVCVTAAYHYHRMLTTPESTTQYRYLDWFFTTPILLTELCLVCGVKNLSRVLPTVTLVNSAMLGAGFIGETLWTSLTGKTVTAAVGFVLLHKLYREVHESATENQDLLPAFFLLWAAYGAVHLVPSETHRAVAFNTLDVLTKAVFGVVVYTRSVRV